MTAHAFLAPSSAHIRQHCGAAARMLASYPKPDSEESLEGTAAHEVAEWMLTGHTHTITLGRTTSNGVVVTEEMIEGAELYFSDVISIVPDLQGLHLEATIECPSINENTFGTPDLWYLSDRNDTSRPWTLTVWDYKFGHRYVETFENWQIIEYVAGILDAIGITGAEDHLLTVDMRVVQPRCFVGGSPVRSWKVKAIELRGHFNEARMFEERSMMPNSPAKTNPHCRDCVPQYCTAAQAAGYNAIDVSMEPQPFAMPAEALGLELKKLKRAKEAIEAREVGLEQQAVAYLRGGTRVPGYRLVTPEGRLAWTAEPAEVFAIGDVLDVNLRKEVPITPTQAIKAGIPAELVATVSARPTGALKLAEDDGLFAKKVFGLIDGVRQL